MSIFWLMLYVFLGVFSIINKLFTDGAAMQQCYTYICSKEDAAPIFGIQRKIISLTHLL